MRRLWSVMIERDDQQWLHNCPRIVLGDDDDAARADCDEVRVRNAQSTPIRQPDCEWLERLLMQRLFYSIDIHRTAPCSTGASWRRFNMSRLCPTTQAQRHGARLSAEARRGSPTLLQAKVTD